MLDLLKKNYFILYLKKQMDTASICRCKLYFLDEDNWIEKGTGYPILDEEKTNSVLKIFLINFYLY